MAKTRSVAARVDEKKLKELKKIYPNETPSEIFRILVDEKIAIQRNTENLFNLRNSLRGTKSDRNLI